MEPYRIPSIDPSCALAGADAPFQAWTAIRHPRTASSINARRRILVECPLEVRNTDNTTTEKRNALVTVFHTRCAGADSKARSVLVHAKKSNRKRTKYNCHILTGALRVSNEFSLRIWSSLIKLIYCPQPAAFACASYSSLMASYPKLSLTHISAPIASEPSKGGLAHPCQRHSN